MSTIRQKASFVTALPRQNHFPLLCLQLGLLQCVFDSNQELQHTLAWPSLQDITIVPDTCPALKIVLPYWQCKTRLTSRMLELHKQTNLLPPSTSKPPSSGKSKVPRIKRAMELTHIQTLNPLPEPALNEETVHAGRLRPIFPS